LQAAEEAGLGEREGREQFPSPSWLACLPEGPRLGPILLSEGRGVRKPFWQIVRAASIPSLYLPPTWKLSDW